MKRAKSSSASAEKKRKVMHVTFEKWKHEFDKDCKAIMWLECKSSMEAGTKVVRKLMCAVCTSILHKRNFNDNWISGAILFAPVIYAIMLVASNKFMQWLY